jgi:alpha-beta hydrolase superfamily lysophospholipase
VTPTAARATIVLFHGVHQNRAQTLGRTAFLVAAGYRCVAFDHRAHGESTGRRTSFGYHEGRDVAAILDLVRENWPRQPCAALGISMGAAALCYAADVVRGCAAVVLESLYHDVASAFASRLAGYPPWFQRLSRGAIWVTERRLGLRLAQLTPAEHIGGLAPTAVLLLTGADDAHAPPTDARRLHERCGGPRELCIVPHAGHRNLFETGGQLYRQHVLEFLERWVAARTCAA